MELHQRGIAGIRYLDNTSRTDKSQQHQYNYVIFNADVVKITKKSS